MSAYIVVEIDIIYRRLRKVKEPRRCDGWKVRR